MLSFLKEGTPSRWTLGVSALGVFGGDEFSALCRGRCARIGTSLLTRRISLVVSDGTAISSPFQKFIEFNGNVNRAPFLGDGLGNPVTVLPFTTNEDTALADCISAVDPDGDPVTVTSISLSSGSGLISTTGGLCFQFIPGPNFNGTDSATVSICDPSNACASGSIEITIDPVNDPPVVFIHLTTGKRYLPSVFVFWMFTSALYET